MLDTTMRSHSFKVFAIVIFILLSLLAIISAEAGLLDAIPDMNKLYKWFFIAFFFSPLLLRLHKIIMAEQIRKWMYGYSESVESELPGVFNKPERPAPAQPTILEYDRDSVLSYQVEQREKMVKRALVVLKYRWRIGAIICLVYIAIAALMSLFSGKLFGETWFTIVVIVGLYFLIISLGYFFNQLEFRPKYETFGNFLPQFRAFVIITKVLADSRLEFLLWFVLAAMLLALVPGSETLLVIGVWIAIVVHFVLLIRLRRRPHEGPNIKLLVLRVFGSTWTAVLTFDRLMRYWKHFGVHFTIDDAFFAKHRYRFFQLRTLLEWLVFVMLALAGLWAVLGAFVVLIVYDWNELLKRRPVPNQEFARQRIQKIMARPRYGDGTFKDLRMAAFMNTWKLVVAEFVNIADVVLFDLREYSEQRAGAQYEVDFLFDTFPAHKIVFLRTANSDKEAIHRLILNSWAAIRDGSPNLNIKQPVLRVYVNSNQKGEEVQNLMDLLLTAADPT